MLGPLEQDLRAKLYLGVRRLTPGPLASGFLVETCIACFYSRGHHRGAHGHQVARKEQVGRPRPCSKNNISMINIFTLTNINTKIIESKLSKIFIFEVCIKLAALRINRHTRSSSQLQKGWWPLFYCIVIRIKIKHLPCQDLVIY